MGTDPQATTDARSRVPLDVERPWFSCWIALRALGWRTLVLAALCAAASVAATWLALGAGGGWQGVPATEGWSPGVPLSQILTAPWQGHWTLPPAWWWGSLYGIAPLTLLCVVCPGLLGHRIVDPVIPIVGAVAMAMVGGFLVAFVMGGFRDDILFRLPGLVAGAMWIFLSGGWVLALIVRARTGHPWKQCVLKVREIHNWMGREVRWTCAGLVLVWFAAVLWLRTEARTPDRLTAAFILGAPLAVTSTLYVFFAHVVVSDGGAVDEVAEVFGDETG